MIREEARKDARTTAREDAREGEDIDMAIYPPLPFTPDEEWPPDPDSEPAESSCVPESSRAEVSTGVAAGGTFQDTTSPSEPPTGLILSIWSLYRLVSWGTRATGRR